jgi:hypothetical protein
MKRKKFKEITRLNGMYLILMASFVVNSYASPGFFLDDWLERNSPDVTNAELQNETSGNPAETFIIDVSDTIAPVLPTIWGNNANFYLYGFNSDSAALAHLRATGVKNLRLPGGNVSNSFLWDGVIHWEFWGDYASGLRSLPTAQYNLGVDDQAAIAESVGAMPQPCVNLALARYIKGSDSVEQAAHYAADWVRQWNNVEGRNVKYWEIGNENYGNWVDGYEVNGERINGAMYGRAFNVFVDSMKAADPTIKIGAVVFEGETNSWTGEWNQDLLPVVQEHADFLVVHQYFTWAQDMNTITVQEVVDALPKIQETVEMLRQQVDSLTDKPADYFPIAMTEYNVRAGRKNSQQISAVFNAMALGEYIRHGYGLVNIWDVANSFNNGEDHGMFTRNDPDRDNYDPNPSFYSYYLTQQYLGDQMLQVSPQEASGVRVYPTVFTEGDLGVLVVNSSASEISIDLDLGGFVSNGNVYSHHLTANGPEEREVFLNGQSGGSVSGPLNYSEIPAFETTFSGNPILQLEPYSVNTYLIEKEENSTGNTLGNLWHNEQRGTKIFFGSLSLPVNQQPEIVQVYNMNGEIVPISWNFQTGELRVETYYTGPVFLKLD